MFQLGVFGGAMVMSDRGEDPKPAPQPPAEFDPLALDIGARLGIYPMRYFGIEGEGAIIFTTGSNDHTARLGGGRGHLVGQLPMGRLTPFALVGGGVLGAACPEEGCNGATGGRETKPAFHFGIGAKLGIAENFHVRLDLRDNISTKHHLPEALLGLAATFGMGEATPPPAVAPADSDGDGKADSEDACPAEAANTPDGCPIADSDSDGVLDDADKCPEVASAMPDGCPDPDADKDGVSGDADKCPDVAGIAPDGCPDADPDKDGIAGDLDKCPAVPEEVNGFEDADGCADVVPEKVKNFTGVIQGITFDLGKATLRPQSLTVLNGTVEVLKEFPSLRLRVTGHTDSTGDAAKNTELSKARAQAVTDYFSQQGIEASRLESVGKGQDEPVADNKTAEGRQKNRRIEFQVIK
jgi:OOP family OmpA-OmpF porin